LVPSFVEPACADNGLAAGLLPSVPSVQSVVPHAFQPPSTTDLADRVGTTPMSAHTMIPWNPRDPWFPKDGRLTLPAAAEGGEAEGGEREEHGVGGRLGHHGTVGRAQGDAVEVADAVGAVVAAGVQQP